MSDSLEQKIERIITSLCPYTGIEGQYGPPKSLYERLRATHTPGVSIAVINDFEIEWARGFGLSEAGTQNKVGTETLFQAASISKPIFALAVMKMVQIGQLDLDEDVNRYLYSWRVPKNEDWQPRITLRQLLSHTAGTTVHGFPGYHASGALPNLVQILNGEFPTNTPAINVTLLPGTQYRYSGGGYTIAQQVMMDKLGAPFPDIMREFNFELLGLENSSYEQPLQPHWAARAAAGHPWNGVPIQERYRIMPEMAAAGLWTTPTDLAKIGVELMQVLEHRKPYALLNKESILAMFKPQLSDQGEGISEYVGLGFHCNGVGDNFSFSHEGLNEGFIAAMYVFPYLGKGAVIMINSNEGGCFLTELLRSIGKEYAWPWLSLHDKKFKSTLDLDDFTGYYSWKSPSDLMMSIDRGHLMFHPLGQQPPFPVFPRTAGKDPEFFAKAVNLSLKFERDETGNVIALILYQEDGRYSKAEKQN